MDTNELRKWAKKYSIENSTIKSFWEMFNNYIEEQKEEFLEVFGKDFDKRQLIIKMDRLGFFIDAWNKDAYFQCGFDHIISFIPIIYKDNHIGEYKMLFNLDGECFDDYFIIF